MKHLPSAPLTDEDCVCLVLNADAKKLHWRLLRHGLALAADRRDADLILRQMLSRTIVIFDEKRLPPLFGRDVYCRVLKGGVHASQIIRSLEWP
jgi:hypothetical protein